MIELLFITFYIKEEKANRMINSLINKVNLTVVNEFNDFKKCRNKKFDVVLTQYYWKIHWVKGQSDKFPRKLPKYINKKLIVFMDSNPLNSLKLENNTDLYRFSIGDLVISKQLNRVDKIINKRLNEINYEIKPYKKKKEKSCILILLQNYFNHFLNMEFNEYQEYIQGIINEVRKYCNNTIIVRYKHFSKEDDHRDYKLELNDPINNMEITKGTPLQNDIDRSFVAIAHSTNAVLKVLLEGVKIISLSEYCLCHQYADHSISDILDLREYDRKKCLEEIVSSAWYLSDFDNGIWVKYITGILKYYSKKELDKEPDLIIDN